MTIVCPACGGRGVFISDCPYCRNTDYFEFSLLTPSVCKCCQDKGYYEDICPLCNGSGLVTKAEQKEYLKISLY